MLLIVLAVSVWDAQAGEIPNAVPLQSGANFACGPAGDGDTLVAGAWGQRDALSQMAGGSHVFIRTASGWVQQAHILDIGGTMSLSGDTLVGGGSERADVWVRSAGVWSHQRQLRPHEMAPVVALIALAIDIDGDDLVIATSVVENGSSHGAAFMWRRTGIAWAMVQRLTTPAAASTDFGHEVAISNGTVVIGDMFAPGGGAAFVYQRTGTTWTLAAHLPETRADGEMAGESVEIDGDTLVIGVPGRQRATPACSGAAVVCRRDSTGWHDRATLFPDDVMTPARVGRTVAIRDGRIVIGAPQTIASVAPTSMGAAYVFEGSDATWIQVAALHPEPMTDVVHSQFGMVEMCDGAVMVGAPWANQGADYHSGSAAIFEPTGPAAAWSCTAAIRPTTRRLPQSVVVDVLPAHTYGDAPFTAPTAAASSGLPIAWRVHGDAADLVGDTITITHAGWVDVIADQPGDPTYDQAAVSQRLTIRPAPLGARARDATRAVGQSDPAFTIDYVGFVNGDDAADLDVLPSGWTTATSTSPPGVYPISVGGGSDGDYAFVGVDGTLTITATGTGGGGSGGGSSGGGGHGGCGAGGGAALASSGLLMALALIGRRRRCA